MAIKDYIKNEEKYLIELRRYFHEHPEESLKEFNTCKKIEEELDKAGIEHRRVGETGVYAWINAVSYTHLSIPILAPAGVGGFDWIGFDISVLDKSVFV